MSTSKGKFVYKELLSHECSKYLTKSMYRLFEETGNKQALRGTYELHPIMKQMCIHVNANGYVRVYACFRDEMSEDNVLGYVWVLIDFDIYGVPQLTIKQFFIETEGIKGIGRALVFARFLRYVLEIGARCGTQRFIGGVMQKEMVSFWRGMKGFKGSEVMMEYNGTAEDFVRDNPRLLRTKEKLNANNPESTE